MVTKIVIHVSPEGRAAAAEDSKRANDIKQNDDTADDLTHDEIDDRAVDICRNNDNSSKKRPLLLDDEGGTEETKRRKRTEPFIDLTDVPPQLPIKNNKKGGSSKYQGVCFDKRRNEWNARIMIHGKQHHIGNYENEEEAAVDYARAVFKYEEGKVNAHRNIGQKLIDFNDVPPQLPVPKSHDRVGSSRYQGVFFNKSRDKWQARIMIDGKTHSIGNYANEEEAAVDYARALFKYGGSRRKRKFIDLTESSKCQWKNGSSKCEGVYFNKANNKWDAQITIDGKQHYIGAYDNEEEAAVDYARAAHTYGVEIIQKGRSSHTRAQQDMRSSAECKNQTHHGEVCRFESVDEKLSFPMELANKGGRIGIYLPDERKARIAKFHAKRSTRVFRRRVTSDSRKKYADSRPRIKGRFVTQKSVVGGEDSD